MQYDIKLKWLTAKHGFLILVIVRNGVVLTLQIESLDFSYKAHSYFIKLINSESSMKVFL